MNTNSPFHQFGKQKFGQVKHQRVKTVLEKLDATQQRLTKRTTEIRGDKDRSSEWKQKELRALAVNTVNDVTRDGAHELKRLRRELHAKRPKPPRPDKSDVVGALED